MHKHKKNKNVVLMLKEKLAYDYLGLELCKNTTVLKK